MDTRHLIIATTIMLLIGATPGWAQAQPSPCGEKITIARADTLSGIAQRCDTTEAALLRANPGIEGSDDLQAGAQLTLPSGPSTGTTVDRLKSLARETGDALTGMAQELGSSVEDLLNKNPDLQQRLRQLGDRLNIPGVDASKAQVSLSPQSGPSGTSLTVSATGLPADAAVVIGGGASRAAYEVLDRARTSANGTLQATVRIPDWAGDRERFVLTVAAPDGSWRVRSAPFQVTGTKL
ncbi:LysM peptidoglycan-binding domain-containing protein [Microvirga sp. BT688]|uniref:lytic transglycosylase n=1 Tax=Microvirga sp. TaxID=1873136 RepID=UPI001682005E|nr:LysM peptidoglycan-binding domain-containing protein [Microvirga sp.]MBD2750847.1 LysM peptidoglycan-binding domain-containing protein [Microvirga sp.]